MKPAYWIIVGIVVAVSSAFFYAWQKPALAPTLPLVHQPVFSDTIKITSPIPNADIQSPLKVTGEARGSWYFEASFPVRLLDANGKQIAHTPAHAKGDWMTTEFMPFEAELIFIKPSTQNGTLLLEKDNPSGLSKNADEVRIPVRFE